MCNCPWCTGAGPPEEPGPCEYCDGDGCEECLDPDDGPDPETYWTARDDVAYDRGEPIRWGGLDVPNQPATKRVFSYPRKEASC